MNIKKEVMQLRAKVLKTTTTGAPSTTGGRQILNCCQKLRADLLRNYLSVNKQTN